MKLRLALINAVFAIVDMYLTMTGNWQFNLMFHRHILRAFAGHSDGYLGLFWLTCLAHDLILFNLLILSIYFVRKRFSGC